MKSFEKEIKLLLARSHDILSSAELDSQRVKNLIDENGAILRCWKENVLTPADQNTAFAHIIRKLLQVNGLTLSRIIEQQRLIAKEIMALRGGQRTPNALLAQRYQILQRVV